MKSANSIIRSRQQLWADNGKIELDRQNWCVRLEDNLFQGLNPEAREEFEQADGSELEGKMRAPHSSSALVCNVFDYWRGQDNSPLTDALGTGAPVTRIKFEEKFPTGVGPRSPNLDVALFLADDTLMAIESKFAEPFYDGAKSPIQDKYFSEGKQRWSEAGLPHCQKLAENLRDQEKLREQYRHLEAGQLLKHMLGLASGAQEWELLYLWYDPTGQESDNHRKEIEHFIKAVSGDGDRVRAMTYQSLFSRLSAKLDAAHTAYTDYLRQRYF